MIRALDLVLSLLGLILALPLLSVLMVVGCFETGSPLFFQERVGRHERRFTLLKLRTMRVGTASVASHLVDTTAVTRVGRWLRRSKLDELPQLWNVLLGDMSLVGPRPCLANQTDVILERRKLGVFSVRPGITGLAQIRHIDMSMPAELALSDAQMIASMTLKSYLRYLLLTVAGKGRGDRIRGS